MQECTNSKKYTKDTWKSGMKISKRIETKWKKWKAAKEKNSYRRQRRSNTPIIEFSKEEKTVNRD